MNLQIRPSAFNDLARGRSFYDFQDIGIGDYFFDSLFSDIDSPKLYAGIHPKVMGYYRMLSKRFPYAIYYEFDGKIAVVWRVLDLRQNPKTISRALDLNKLD